MHGTYSITLTFILGQYLLCYSLCFAAKIPIRPSILVVRSGQKVILCIIHGSKTFVDYIPCGNPSYLVIIFKPSIYMVTFWEFVIDGLTYVLVWWEEGEFPDVLYFIWANRTCTSLDFRFIVYVFVVAESARNLDDSPSRWKKKITAVRDGDSTREHGSHFDLAQLVERNPMHASGWRYDKKKKNAMANNIHKIIRYKAQASIQNAFTSCLSCSCAGQGGRFYYFWGWTTYTLFISRGLCHFATKLGLNNEFWESRIPSIDLQFRDPLQPHTRSPRSRDPRAGDQGYRHLALSRSRCAEPDTK